MAVIARPVNRAFTMTAVATLVAAGAAAVSAGPAGAVTGTTDLSAQTATQVAQSLVGAGVVISNVTQSGGTSAAGTFTGGAASVGFDAGVTLSSGDIATAVGPNTADSTSTTLGTPGDADLTALAGVSTNDASVLEFDFVPNGDTVYFRYVFASEEYNEFVNSSFNDAFGFFVNGVNCATVDTGSGPQPITVNTINNGNPYGDAASATNPALYRNNDLSDGGGAINTGYDGLTVVLTCMSPVNTGVTNHLKLAIADGSDTILDSGVFLEQGSLSTTPPAGSAKVTGGGRVDEADGYVTFGTNAIKDAQGLRGNLQVNDHRTGDRFHGYSVTSFSKVDNTATWAGEGRLNGEDGYTYEVTVVDNRNGNTDKKGSPDQITITIKDGSGATVWTNGPDSLTRGNITVHAE